jgi:hypothetical protein
MLGGSTVAWKSQPGGGWCGWLPSCNKPGIVIPWFYIPILGVLASPWRYLIPWFYIPICEFLASPWRYFDSLVFYSYL